MSSEPASDARLKLWGVRGSIPVPGPTTVRYGGNTSCVEVRADGEIIVLDAGSGIRLLGIALEQEFGSRPINLTLLITHAHWDHFLDNAELLRLTGAKFGFGLNCARNVHFVGDFGRRT